MVDATNGEVKRALITIAVEKALLKIGNRELEETGNRLYAKYHCYFADCLEHPEYLSDVLKEIFGNSHTSIVKSIKEVLEEFAYQKPIKDFLRVLSE